MQKLWVKKTAVWLGQLVLFLALLLLVERYMTRDALRGDVPDLAGESVQGNALDIRDYAGRPLVIYFWATWCPVCVLEQGAMNALADDYLVIGVAMQSGGTDEVAAYIDEKGIRYPVLNDPDGRLAAVFGVSGVPAGFIVDRELNIRYVTHGYTTGLGLRARLNLLD